jgi:hypothetical protein
VRNAVADRSRRIPPKDVDVELPPSTGGDGGGVFDEVWTVGGRLCVRESEIDSNVHDRPLSAIEVRVSARDRDSGPWRDGGTASTGADGSFLVRDGNHGKSRFLRVRARLVGPDLEVSDLASSDRLDTPWRTIWESTGPLEGSAVSIGTRVFAPGGAGDLGNPSFRRQALVWYVLRTAIDRLEAEDPWFAMNRKICMHQGNGDTDWQPHTVLHRFMHLWRRDHSHGTVDLQTLGTQENPNVAFAEGCAAWASDALRHELWGTRMRRPLNRRYVASELGLATPERVEKSRLAVESALRMLNVDDNRGWWSHLFGTAEAYPGSRPKGHPDGWTEVGIAGLGERDVPAGAHSLSFWDVLRTFRACPVNGWDTDLEVGNADHGIVRFIDRVADIHHLGENVRTMLKRCIDPLATDEPRDALPLRRSA